MYTQCPKCQTVFRITLEQLQTRDGVVRCGQCTHVFQADQHLYTEIPGETPKKNEKGRLPATAKKLRRGKTGAFAAAEPPPHRSARAPAHTPRVLDKTAAIPTVHASARIEKRSTKRHGDVPQVPSIAALLDRGLARQPSSILWILGITLLMILLAAQAAYFLRDTLAEDPQWRPFVVEFCLQLDCVVPPTSDIGRIELIQPTSIAPHPRIRNALRLRATAVNRAENSQPYPWMEVTLTDSTGGTLSRRIFKPREYLEQPALAETEMSPNLAIGILLDVTNPYGKAVGYQIDFVAPQLH